jgi:hypothetical protein
LVLQFPGSTLNDFDALVALEDALIGELKPLGEVDGHDLGSDEGNIFISTDDPRKAFQKAKEILGHLDLNELRAAFRLKDGDEYTVLWPPELRAFSVK